MGISHPYLAILSVIAFVSVLTSATFAYLYIVDQATRAPILGVYAEALVRGNELVIAITMKHVHGKGVAANSVRIYGEGGRELLVVLQDGACYVLDDPGVSCYLTGLQGTLLLPGGVGQLQITLPAINNYFYEGKTYQGIVFFSEGTYPIAFTPIRVVEYYPPAPTPHPVLPVSFTPPLHDKTCVTLNKTERRGLRFINYTDFDRYTTGWVSANYSGGSLPRDPPLVDGFAGRGVLLNESGVGFGVYYLDLELDRKIVRVVTITSRFRLVNGTGYHGLVYIFTSEGKKPPHAADRGVAVLLNITRENVSLVVVDLERLDDLRDDKVVNTVWVPRGFDLTKWYMLFAVFNVADRSLSVVAKLYNESYGLVAVATGSIAVPDLPDNYVGLIINDNVVVADDITIIKGGVQPVILGGLPLGELYSIRLLDPRGVLVVANSSQIGYVEFSIATGLANGSKIEVYYPSSLRCLVYVESDHILPGDVFNLTHRRINYTLGRFNASANITVAVSTRNDTFTGFPVVGVVNYDEINYTLTLDLTIERVVYGNVSLVLYDTASRRWVTLNETTISVPRVLLTTLLAPNSTVYIYFEVRIPGEGALLYGSVTTCALEAGTQTYCIVLPLRVNLTR